MHTAIISCVIRVHKLGPGAICLSMPLSLQYFNIRPRCQMETASLSSLSCTMCSLVSVCNVTHLMDVLLYSQHLLSKVFHSLIHSFIIDQNVHDIEEGLWKVGLIGYYYAAIPIYCCYIRIIEAHPSYIQVSVSSIHI